MLKVITVVATLLASAAVAQTDVDPFNVYTMQVLDIRIPFVQHNISFTVNAPNNTVRDGGSDYGLCAIGWFQSDSPACWTKCGSQVADNTTTDADASYYARIDKYNSPDQFNITIWQKYPGFHNTGVIVIRDGKAGYYCSHGVQTTQCSIGFPFKPIRVEAEKDEGYEPTTWPLC